MNGGGGISRELTLPSVAEGPSSTLPARPIAEAVSPVSSIDSKQELIASSSPKSPKGMQRAREDFHK